MKDSKRIYDILPKSLLEIAVILIRTLKLEQVKRDECINDFEHIPEYAIMYIEEWIQEDIDTLVAMAQVQILKPFTE